MKFIKLSLAAALVASVAFAEEAKSDLEISANVAMTSNYVWRGMTQSNDSPAIQGGLDVEYKGLYVGAWGSNINFSSNPDASMELDAYGGYKNEIAGIGYDIGYIQYAYPNDSKALNFGEAYVGLSYDFKVVEVSAKYSLGVNTDTIDPENAYEGAVSIPLPMDISIDATVGNYENTGVYYIAGITKTIGKFDFSVAYSGMDFEAAGTDTEENVIATISASF
ncbi:TorF family putative porin [Sulfurimonas sp.]|uniref:TorF family putative porin n=1 Tax=Sulfurimonas sp. TaxID=2022749 RepID=UPI003562781E